MIGLFTITSDLHKEVADKILSDPFLASLASELDFEVHGQDFSDYGKCALDLIYVRTGGTEGIFRSLFPQISKAGRGVVLLTSGKSNSLAASMEILCWLRQRGYAGEIVQGDNQSIISRVKALLSAKDDAQPGGGRFVGFLPETLSLTSSWSDGFRETMRLGVVGHPSDWLISSDADADALRSRLGLELVDVPMDELVSRVVDPKCPCSCPSSLVPLNGNLSRADLRSISESSFATAMKVYHALKSIVNDYKLDGLTVRCFDLLTSVSNTGCMALAMLNAEGVPSSCEGDVPALVSMMICRKVLGLSSFQANPSRIDASAGTVVFAHCTIPLDMVESYKYDTHFESGIGVAVKGELPLGDVTVFKVSPDLKRVFAVDAQLLGNMKEENLCRTQIVVKMDPEASRVFLTDPVGNHQIIVPGHHAGELMSL
ncbi:MAG: hypothetical protein MJY67_01600 [Bacteroidales bacterium]|nr:hypothetical protein [Bacteroidales bacterium]